MVTKNRQITAIAAVTISIARMPCIGSQTSNSAPIGAAPMFIIPISTWFNPWMRDRCSFGTIKEVEACIADQWNKPKAERNSISA